MKKYSSSSPLPYFGLEENSVSLHAGSLLESVGDEPWVDAGMKTARAPLGAYYPWVFLPPRAVGGILSAGGKAWV